MRAKTVKRLAILIFLFGLVGLSGYLIWGFQVERMAQGVIAQATQAEANQDYTKAVDLYQQHIQIVPDDAGVLIKYADDLLKLEKTAKHQEDALGIYSQILKESPVREDVRRKAAELAVEMGQYETARVHLANLLKRAKEDGHLEFLMGRCYEHDQDAANAVKAYRAAIEHQAPERLDAYQRLAVLLRDPIGQPAQADQAIEAMVQSDPNNYRVYLERGRYCRRFELPGAAADFQKALELAPDQPETYLEAARLAERTTGLDAARELLAKGLDAAPKSVELYLALANLERRSGRLDRSIEIMEVGLKAMPRQIPLRFELATWLAARGDTDKLLLHIEELKDQGLRKIFIDYLMSYYYLNIHEYSQARQILVALQPAVAQIPALKARVNVLLARCYGQLNEPEKQWDAATRAVVANPEDVAARLDWVAGMIRRGDIEGAIQEYQRLLSRVPQVRIPLAQLLIQRNRQRPRDQRDWGEVERLIDDAAKAAPGSIEPVVLRATLYAEQDQGSKARDALETARSRFPRAVEPWVAEAQLLAREKKYDEALELLDRARQRLGDRIEFRHAGAAVWVAKGGPQAAAALNDLGKDIASFPKESRRSLLAFLAIELGRHQDLQGAARMWSRLAEQEPQDLDSRLHLFELALQTADQARIEPQIEAIEKIDESHGRICRVDYLLWQASRAPDKAEKERLWTDARALLTELKTHRPDWATIALETARIEEQELAQGRLDTAQKREKQESLIISYLKAIELGARDAAVVRRTVELLFSAGRGNEAIQLVNRIPAASQLGDLERLASRYALENRDFQQAEEIARKAVAAHPGDLPERIWLVKILLQSGQPDKAEFEIRQAVDEAKNDPNRWISLVEFLVLTRQPEKAEQAVQEAQAYLSEAPLALAQCCETMGRAYDGATPTDQAKKWYDEARQWFAKAQAAQKDHDDFSIERRLAEFLLRTNQLAEAQKQLKEILGRKVGVQGAGNTAWARRGLALTYIAGNPPQPAEALAVMKSASDDPEDRRVLARVLNAQGTPEYRSQAIEVLNSLINQNLATPEDRFVLAQIEEASDQWLAARDQYRELILRTGNARDMETIRRRPAYLSLFAESLLRHHKPGEDRDLNEVQELVEKLKQLQPDLLATLQLEVALDKARNRPDDAAARIRSNAERPNLNPQIRADLARMAEEIGQFELAEQIYRRIAADPGLSNKLVLLQFRVRRGELDKALDLCEALWKEGRDRESVAGFSIAMVADPKVPASKAQVRRVIGWLEQASRENPRVEIFRLGLGNLYERLEEDQKAEEQYRAIVNNGDRNGTASNNLAWLIVMRGGNLNEALDLIDKAVKAGGPLLPEFLDTRGVVYLAKGEGQRAITDFEAAVKAAPSASKWFHLAQAYLKVNDKNKAKKSLEAGMTQGLPNGLHPREVLVYQKTLDDLGR